MFVPSASLGNPCQQRRWLAGGDRLRLPQGESGQQVVRAASHRPVGASFCPCSQAFGSPCRMAGARSHVLLQCWISIVTQLAALAAPAGPLDPMSWAAMLSGLHPVGRLGRGCQSSAWAPTADRPGKTWGHRAAPLEDLSVWKISLKRLFSTSEEYESRTG